jgi:adenosylcobinamide-phosphate synthase
LAGGSGVVAYRLVNTLDAMWGYRNDRYRYFGWAAARLDDGLNYVPARLTALSYALCGKLATALQCWRMQAGQWKSRNAGAVMAAGAGSLGLELGGPATYAGKYEARSPLGAGHAARPADIDRALYLIDKALVLWLLAIMLFISAAAPSAFL